jgi:uncharacterized protein VirK/YbjX
VGERRWCGGLNEPPGPSLVRFARTATLLGWRIIGNRQRHKQESKKKLRLYSFLPKIQPKQGLLLVKLDEVAVFAGKVNSSAMLKTYRALFQASSELYRGGHWGNPKLFAQMWLLGMLNFRSVSEIYSDTPYGNISKILTDEPHFLGLLVWPLVDARWTAKQRLQNLMLHYREAARLGELFQIVPRQIKSILKLDSLCESLEVCLENQPWFAREGQCTMSLFYAGERVYSVAFLLSEEDGKRIVYIGAVQGVKQSDSDDTYKLLTKAAHGMRPRDFCIALFLVLCDAMGVQKVLAVQNGNRQHQHRYFDATQRAAIFANYDEIWTENGATLRPDGLFTLEPGVRRKDLAEVPSKKRSMYRKREALLEECQLAFNALVTSGLYPQPGQDCDIPCDEARILLPQAVRHYRKKRHWLEKVSPALWGSWLWSFPAVVL